jgi:hypothetical protein
MNIDLTYTRGWNPICISKLSIGKNYMWISANPDVRYNSISHGENRSITGYVFDIVNSYIKFKAFFTLLTFLFISLFYLILILFLSLFLFRVLWNLHRFFFRRGFWCAKNMQFVWRKCRTPNTEFWQNLTHKRCSTFNQTLIETFIEIGQKIKELMVKTPFELHMCWREISRR